MAKKKLVLDETTEEDVSLIAMHCPAEIFRVVYVINRELGLNLAREKLDVDFQHKKALSYFPLYHYFDSEATIDFYVVANASKTKSAHVISQGGLFPDENSYSTFLIPEYKTADYFLKIEGHDKPKEVLLKLKRIKHITTAYTVEVSSLKSYKNLIFN